MMGAGHGVTRGESSHWMTRFADPAGIFYTISPASLTLIHARAQRAAIPAISTKNFGLARRASTVARAGLPLGSTHASHAAFISS